MEIATRIAELSLPSRHPDLPGPELLPSRLMKAMAAALPIAGAGISLFTRHRLRVPLGASSEEATLAERLQSTIGEGPCLAAHETGLPVLATARVMARRWPAFHDELVGHTSFRAIVSLPVAGYSVGGDASIDIYYAEPELSVSDQHRQNLEEAVDVVAALLVAGSGLEESTVTVPVWLSSDTAKARARVWEAIGVVVANSELGPSDALALLRSYAYGSDQTIDRLAERLVNHELPAEALTV